MLESPNIQLVHQWVEQVWNAANLHLIDHFHPSTFENHGRLSNAEAMKEWHLQMRATYPDLYYKIEDIFAAGNRVAFRWTATATHHDTLWELIPPTHKAVRWSGIHMVRIENYQIVEIWAVADTLSVLQQLGVTLQPPTIIVGNDNSH